MEVLRCCRRTCARWCPWTAAASPLRPERSVSARDQPQQPPEAPAELKAPEIIVKNEKRMLQEAVDRFSTTTPRQGHDRRQQAPAEIARRYDQARADVSAEPAGQRVDYSGRSVIVVGPVEAAQCGPAEEWRSNCSNRSYSTSSSCRALPPPSGGEARSRGRNPGRLGHPGGRDPRASGDAQSRPRCTASASRRSSRC